MAWYRPDAKMEIWSKLRGMAPVCEGAGSYFVPEQSLVIFVTWPRAWVILCNKFGQNICMFVVSQPLEALRRSAFSNVAAMGIWLCDTPL